MDKGTFAYMLQQYGLATAYDTGTVTGTSGVNGNTYDIALSPLFGVRGGFINPSISAPFLSAGNYGLYWSSRAYSNTSYAYYLAFSTSVKPSFHNIARYSGYSLRCLIPTP